MPQPKDKDWLNGYKNKTPIYVVYIFYFYKYFNLFIKFLLYIFNLFLFNFLRHWEACGILVPIYLTGLTHSSVLAWRIPGTGKPGGLPCMGSHRVGHDWSDLAVAAVAVTGLNSSPLQWKHRFLQILNHWTTKEVPIYILLYVYIYIFCYIDCFFPPQMVGCPVLYTPPASYLYFLSNISWPPDLVLKPALHPDPHLSHSIWCLSVGQEGFPGGTSIKNLPARARNSGSIPRLGRSPGGGHGNPLQHSCLKNPMDWGAWQATVHVVAKSWTRLSD